MIDEALQDQAALHALGFLSEPEAKAFARQMEANPELTQLVGSLRATTAALAWAAPQVSPTERLKTDLLARMAEPLRPRFGGFGAVPAWVPWAAAALFLVASSLLLAERGRLRREVSGLHGDVGGLQQQVDGLRGELAQRQAAYARTQGELVTERDRLRGEVARLQASDALAKVQLRALQATAGQQKLKAVAVVAWDPASQRGVFEVQKLPSPAPGKDYQLWAIAPGQPAPVSAGVFRVDASGRAQVRFHPTVQGLQQANFAVSLEPAGGSPKPAGPILLLSQ